MHHGAKAGICQKKTSQIVNMTKKYLPFRRYFLRVFATSGFSAQGSLVRG